jgi:crotonobetainyl-CoA:carnitine CoA-transferase CaiB-like acyl-CoA transferase
MTDAGLPLSHISVLDLSRYRAGPAAVRQLADWGAEVIRVEIPERPGEPSTDMIGDRHGVDFQNLHRNKRAISLDLKKDKGRQIFFRLCERADVVVENFRSSVKTRLGIDYDAVRKVNPRIVYGSISGFGQTGPYADKPGVDQIAQGMGGLMSITGLPGQGPVRVGIPITDLSAGLLLAQGILIALIHRDRTGEGQWVHTSLLEAVIHMLDFQTAQWLIKGEVPTQAGNHHPTHTPTGLFETKDGYVNVGGLWDRFCAAVGRPDLQSRPEYATEHLRYENRHKLRAELNEITRAMTTKDLTAALDKAGIPCGPVYDIRQVFEDPQVAHLDMVRTVEHPSLGALRMVGQGLQMGGTPLPASLRRHAPEAGEHTDEILADLGYSRHEIARLRRDKVI